MRQYITEREKDTGWLHDVMTAFRVHLARKFVKMLLKMAGSHAEILFQLLSDHLPVSVEYYGRRGVGRQRNDRLPIASSNAARSLTPTRFNWFFRRFFLPFTQILNLMCCLEHFALARALLIEAWMNVSCACVSMPKAPLTKMGCLFSVVQTLLGLKVTGIPNKI